MKNNWLSIVRAIVIVVMPFFLGFLAIRLIIWGAPYYVTYEYAKPNFPEDLNRYSPADREALGLEPFTEEQRRELALVAVDYLNRSEPAEEVIYLLEEQRLPGSEQPLYNDAEIGHMIDVKRLTDAIGRLLWIAATIVVVGLGLLWWQSGDSKFVFRTVMQGGIATTLLLLLLALFIVFGWSLFFVQFHELLFPPGTWTFAYSDSLIRLFPEKFWFDVGVLLSIGALSFGILATLIGFVLQRRGS
jgi:integral membrane protein (TIGR01906 family)